MAPTAPAACLWCGASLAGGSAAGDRRLRCAACGAETTWPAPTAAELDAAYSGPYRPERGRFSGPGDRLLRHSRGRLAGRLDRIAPAGEILDVGSGDGALLEALRMRGRRAVGAERDTPAAQGGPWAAIVLWHSLEHLPDAGERLGALAASLAGGGAMVIAMPNLDGLQARAFGDRWLHLDLPRHLVHVPAGALLERLRASGLRVERVSYLRGGQVVFGWLHGLVGLLPGHPDLYDAIRRPEARSAPLGSLQRAFAVAAAAVLLPVALALAALEAGLRRGGTVYVEARRV